jgi:hypothetical protein
MRNTLKANAMRIEQVVEEQTKGKMLELNSQREPAKHSTLAGKPGRMSALQKARMMAKERARAAEARQSATILTSGL